MSIRGGIVLAAAVLLTAGAVLAAEFEPIPESEKDLYKFDLDKNFYPDIAAFEADLSRLVADVQAIETQKGRLGRSEDGLYKAYFLNDGIIPTWWKLWVYANLRYSINTDDTELMDRIEKVSGDLDSKLQFLRTETQAIDDAILTKFMKRKPQLKDFAFAIDEARRYRPRTLSLDKEEVLSTLSPYLGSWSERLYQTCLDRTDFPDIVFEGDTLDVNLNFAALINVDDRDVRKKTWLGEYESMAEHSDIYALALVKAIETRNKIASMRGFRNYPDARFFDLFLTYEDAAGIFGQIADHAHIRKEYEAVRQARIKATTGYDTVYIWDRQVQPKDFAKPRFDIHQASDILQRTLSVFGAEYLEELSTLLDPNNHRLDLVAGPKRVPGMFATGFPGAPYQFYSQSYNGYLSEVSGLAHESGHAIHHQIQTNAGVRPSYIDGPRYITESIAATNEMLVMYYLYANESDLKTRAYYLEQFLENALGLLTNNMFAHLEFKIYEGVENGTIRDENDLDSLAVVMTNPYSMYYPMHPQYKGVWCQVHHYFDVPMYFMNYVLAQAISNVFMDRILNEPGFVDRYLSLLRSGFDKPAPEMLKGTTGVDIHDPSLLASGFAFLEDKIGELRDIYEQMGIHTN